MKTKGDFYALDEIARWKRCIQEMNFWLKYLVDRGVVFKNSVTRNGAEVITISFPATIFEWDDKEGLVYKVESK